jgi:hypothetical protein
LPLAGSVVGAFIKLPPGGGIKAAGTILYYDGKSWTQWTAAGGVDLRGVWYDATLGGVWAVGEGGVIVHKGPATK